MGLHTLAVAFLAFVAGFALHSWTDSALSSDRSIAVETPVTAISPSYKSEISEHQSAALDEVAISQAPPAQFVDLLHQATVFDTLSLAFRIASESDLPDAEGSLRAALAMDDPLFQRNIADIFLERMSALDINKAISFTESLPAGRNKHQLTISVLATWARMDADGALAYLREITDIQLKRRAASVLLRDNGLPVAVRQRSKVILASSEAMLSTTVSSLGVNSWGTQVSRELAMLDSKLRDDPEGTINAILFGEPSQQKQMLLSGALNKLYLLEPELALSFVERYPAELGESAGQLLSLAAQADPLQVQSQIETYTRRSGDASPMKAMIAAIWKTDREQALEYFQGVDPRFKQSMVFQFARQYIEEDPYEGVKWMLSQDTRGQGMSMVLGYNSPEVTNAAETVLSELPTGSREWENLLIELSGSQASYDPEGALARLEPHKGEAAYDAAYQRVLGHWASNDPLAAAEQLSRDTPAQVDQSVYAQITHRLARIDPDRAEEWARGLPSSDARQAATSSLIGTLGQWDQERARALFDTLPAGTHRDRAGAGLAAQMAGRDPEKFREAMRELKVSEQAIDAYALVWSTL